jgi:8-oxo-dGTP diphosphatase
MIQTVVCVGAVVMKGDRVLLVRQAKGHQLEGQWTIPWGILEAGESPSNAVVRETQEEAGVMIAVEGLLGVQELPRPWEGWIALVYLCQHLEGEPEADDHETDSAGYFSLADLRSFNEPAEKWSLWLAQRALAGGVTVIRSDQTNPYQPNEGFL